MCVCMRANYAIIYVQLHMLVRLSKSGSYVESWEVCGGRES